MNPDQNNRIVDEIFSRQSEIDNRLEDGHYRKLGLKFNPFPRSGTTNINSSDLYNQQLVPVDQHVKTEIIDFISHSLINNHIDPEDKFISATITGDYGSGKTQLLMFVKCLLGEVATLHKGDRAPYVIYIDNPGVKLLELVGAIISKIGEENFKKFIWGKITYRISIDSEIKHSLEKFQHKGTSLFNDTNPDPYSDENTTSYKKFLNSFVRYINTAKLRQEFETSFKEVLLRVLEAETGNSILAQFFYQLISEDYGANKTWEALSSGNIKQLDNKESKIIQYIVKLIKEQGYTDFFILVDEFEDITEGRLSKAQVDNYVYNLRTLLDEQRSWCLLFAMTGQALKKLRSVSPPLADRITSRLIVLQDLNNEQAKNIVLNHLNIARDKSSNDLTPFDNSGVEKLNNLTDGNARKFLKNCYFLVEKASQIFQNPDDRINAEFISLYYPKSII